MNSSLPRCTPAGDSAVMIDLGSEIDPEINARVHELRRRLEAALGRDNNVEIVPGYASLLVQYDPRRITYAQIVRALDGTQESPGQAAAPRTFTLPVVYGGEFGPDLAGLARERRLAEEDVILRHASREYPIYCLGFAPGFPFLGGLDPALATPRRDTPRARVPAGSVAIGGRQTGVYPTPMPGGWHIIGRCPLVLFDPSTLPPVAYAPGDIIRFTSISEASYQALASAGRMPEPDA